MELRLLRTFVTVARHLHFTKAADELGYAQSSVTAQIKALESDLGVTLFHRLTTRITLTDAGKELLPRAVTLLYDAQRARDAITALREDGHLDGTLHLAAPESLCTAHLPPVLHTLIRRHPRARVVFHPSARAPLLAGLADGTLDGGFLLEHTVDIDSLTIPSVTAIPMMREPFRLVCAPDDPLTLRREITLDDLAEHTHLLIKPGCAQRALMDHELHRGGLHPHTIEFTSLEPVKRCAANGLGIALLPAAAVAREIAAGELAALPWTGTPALHVYAVHHEDRPPTRLLHELLTIARHHWQPPTEPDTQPARQTP